MLVGIENNHATEHPRIHAQEAAGPIQLGQLVDVMKAKVSEDQKELQGELGRAVMEWTTGEVGSRAHIVAGEGRRRGLFGGRL